ncbi:Hatching enzyme 1.2 (Choriolysin H homolog 1) (High choriolytic enzyme 1 homolog) (zHCE-1) [Durusdinium trenchii]|uniref:Metalloendopeptidase n=1 Tax=Durusdinium trenchii TaxID=1381693 RepID=A0ABP0QCC0_9DINO
MLQGTHADACVLAPAHTRSEGFRDRFSALNRFLEENTWGKSTESREHGPRETGARRRGKKTGRGKLETQESQEQKKTAKPETQSKGGLEAVGVCEGKKMKGKAMCFASMALVMASAAHAAEQQVVAVESVASQRELETTPAQEDAPGVGHTPGLRKSGFGDNNNDEDPLEQALNGEHYEGDIDASFEEIREMFGEQSAKEAAANGEIPGPTGGRDLGLNNQNDLLWKTRVNGKIQVPYAFKSGQFTASQRSTIINALNALAQKVGVISFVPRASQTDYVEFKSDGAGCWSKIGRKGGKQPINLETPGCVSTRVVQHEMIHALGAWHEQSRPDRDSFVSILWDNIIPGKEHNFDKRSQINSLGVSYDYESIMHYGPTAFAKKEMDCKDSTTSCNKVVALKFKGPAAGSPAKCLDVRSGHTGLYNGIKVQLWDCGALNWHNQLFYVQRYDDESVVFKYAYDTSYCLDVRHGFNTVPQNGMQMQLWKCTGPANGGKNSWYENQRFHVMGGDLNAINLRWESDSKYCLDRHSPNKNAASYNGQKVQMWECDAGSHGYANQIWDTEWFTIPGKTYGCSKLPLWCETTNKRKTTIWAKGNTISNSKLSNKDIQQLRLMYKCSAPRRVFDLCSPDCPCGWFEGDCDKDADCYGSYKCLQRSGVDVCVPSWYSATAFVGNIGRRLVGMDPVDIDDTHLEGDEVVEPRADAPFGLEIAPGKPRKVTIDAGGVLLLTAACLGETVQKNERAVLKLDCGDGEATLCSLVPFVQENVALDVPLMQSPCTFSVACAKKTTVHLLGRLVLDFGDDDDSDDERGPDDEDVEGMEDEDRTYANIMNAGNVLNMLQMEEDEEDDEEDDEWQEEDDDESESESSEGSDDEDEDEDEDGGDGEAQLHQLLASKFPKRSTVEIKEISEEDEESSDESSTRESHTRQKSSRDSSPSSSSSGGSASSASSGSEKKATIIHSASGKKRKQSDATPPPSKKMKNDSTPTKTPPKSVNGKSESSAKSPVGRTSLVQRIRAWVKEDNNKLQLSLLGNRIFEEYGRKYKSFGFQTSLKDFLTNSGAFKVSNGVVALAPSSSGSKSAKKGRTPLQTGKLRVQQTVCTASPQKGRLSNSKISTGTKIGEEFFQIPSGQRRSSGVKTRAKAAPLPEETHESRDEDADVVEGLPGLSKTNSKPEDLVRVLFRSDFEPQGFSASGSDVLAQYKKANHVDWERFEKVRVEERKSFVRRVSQRDVSQHIRETITQAGTAPNTERMNSEDLSESQSSQPSRKVKQRRALQLLRVMTKMYAKGEDNVCSKLSSWERYRPVGETTLNGRLATLSVLKKEFYSITKQRSILLSDNLVLVCFDPVQCSETQVLTSTFLKFILAKYLDGKTSRQRNILEKVLRDFNYGLLPSPTAVNPELKFAVFGLTKLSSCKANADMLPWDKAVSDSILRSLLEVVSECRFDPNAEINDTPQLQALAAIWSLSNNSFLLRARMSSMNAVSAVLCCWTTLRQQFDLLTPVTGFRLLYFLVGSLASLSLDSDSQASVWQDRRCVEMLEWILGVMQEGPATEARSSASDETGKDSRRRKALRHKIEHGVLLVVKNSSVKLREFLREKPSAEGIRESKGVDSSTAKLIEEKQVAGRFLRGILQHYCLAERQGADGAATWSAVHAIVSVLANARSILCEFVLHSPLDAMADTVLSWKDVQLCKNFQEQGPAYVADEEHFFLCLIVVLGCIAREHRELRTRACQVLLFLYRQRRFHSANQAKLSAAALDVLIGAMSHLESSISHAEWLTTLAMAMIDGLEEPKSRTSEHHQDEFAVAFNIARLRFQGTHAALCRLLVNRGAMSVLSKAVAVCWEDKRLRLQLSSALVTLSSFVNHHPEIFADHIAAKDEVKQVIASYADEEREAWIRDTMIVSNCATLIWNMRGKQVLSATFAGLATEVSGAYFHALKPIWGLVNGAMTHSFVQILDEALRCEADNVPTELLDSFVRLLVQHLKQCGGIVKKHQGILSSIACEPEPHKSLKGLMGTGNKDAKRQLQAPAGGTESASLAVESFHAQGDLLLMAQVPYGASRIIKQTDALMKTFLAPSFEKSAQEEDESAWTKELLHNHIKKREGVQSTSSTITVDPTKLAREHDAFRRRSKASEESNKFLQIAQTRAATTLSMFRTLLTSLSQLERHRAPDELSNKLLGILQSALTEAAEVLFFMGSSSACSARVHLDCAKALWLLMLSCQGCTDENVNESRLLRLGELVVRVFHRTGPSIHQEAVALLLRFLMHVRPMLLKPQSKLVQLFARKGLDSLIIRSMRAQHGKQEKTNLLACLHLLSMSKVLQVRFAKVRGVILELLTIAKSVDSNIEARELAVATLVRLNQNPANLTAFYMVELQEKAFRSKLREWTEASEAFDALKDSAANCLMTQAGNQITLGASKSREPQLFAEPLTQTPEVRVDVEMFDEVSPVNVQMATHGELQTEDDLLPTPRNSTLVERVQERPAWLRGSLRSLTLPKLTSFEPSGGLNPHAFMSEEDGRLLDVPLEFVLTLDESAPEAETGPGTLTSMRFMQASTMSLSVEDDDEWDLDESVFAPRAHPALDAGRYWNTDASAEEAMNWDTAMVLRKPSFFRKISSRYAGADVQASFQCLSNDYTSMEMVFNFYTATEKAESSSKLSDSTHNIFCLSRSQFWQFLEDHDLPRLAAHMSFGDFDQIYEDIVGLHCPLTLKEVEVNQQSIVMRVGKRGAPMLRYQFLESIFHLADAMFVRAPNKSPNKMRHLCRGVLFLVERCFKGLGNEAAINADLFRHHSLYRMSIHKVFKRNLSSLQTKVFERYAGASPQSAKWGGAPKLRMALPDWNMFLDDLGAGEYHGFGVSDSNIIFQLSILRVANLTDDWFKACALSFTSFLEALARLVQFLPLPGQGEMKSYGVTSIVAYYDLCHAAKLWNLSNDRGTGVNVFHKWMEQWQTRPSRGSVVAEANEIPSGGDPITFGGGDQSSPAVGTLQDSTGKFHMPEALFSDAIEPEQVKAIVELTLGAQEITAKRQTRHACWNARLTPLHQCKEPFDLQVAKALHLNRVIGRQQFRQSAGLGGQTLKSSNRFDPWIQQVDGVRIDVANTGFEQLPLAMQKEYLSSAYCVCERIRSELDQCNWEQHIQTINMIQQPAVELKAHQVETKGPLVHLEWPAVEGLHRAMMNEGDVIIIKRLSSRRFEETACKALYNAASSSRI